MTRFLSPDTGEVLTADTPHSLADAAGRRWPVAAGIPYLRRGRDEFRHEALGLLDAGDETRAVAVLLRDQDPFAPVPPPALEVTRGLAASDNESTLRGVMRALNFGPVADYFAHRTSTPTYLSGLELLARVTDPGGRTVVELACGVGHFLRDLTHFRTPCVGVDLVYAKLWLARRFIAPGVGLVCGDAADPPVDVDGGALAFCHDAFYFFPDKPAVAAAMDRVAGLGPVVVGHAHNKLVDSGVAGTPLTPAGYAELFPGATLYDDAELADAARLVRPAPARTPAELAGAEAVSLIAREGGPIAVPITAAPRRPVRDLAVPPAGVPLVLNPLLRDTGGTLEPDWPSERFAREYRAATYLTGEPVPAPEVLAAAARGERSPEIDRLARNRILIDVPEGW